MFKGVKNGYKTNISGYRWATILLLTVLFTPLKAQNDVEYRMDVGAGAGVLNYLGDFNGNLLKTCNLWVLLSQGISSHRDWH